MFDGFGLPGSQEAISEQFLVFCGVAMGSMASFLNCLGLNLQKLSLCDPANEQIPPLRQKQWLLGLCFVVVGSVIDFLAFGLAPQSLLAPLAALALVWNLGMAAHLLGEQYGKTDILAAITIIIGTGLCVSNAPHREIEYDLEGLIELWSHERVGVYIFVVATLLSGHYLLVQCSEDGKSVFQRLDFASKSLGHLRMVGYCGFAGITGGQSLLFAKSLVELIKSAFEGSGSFWHWETYAVLTALVLCLLTQVHFLNSALKHFDSLYVIPVYQSYWILAGVVGGLICFGEWEEMQAQAARHFVLGIGVTFAGLFILTRKEKTRTTRKYSIVSQEIP